MATATFAARIQLDLVILISAPSLIDLTNQRDLDTVTNTVLLGRVCQMAAAKIGSKLGDVGDYDDTDGTIGDQEALDLGIRLALHYLTNVYTLTQTQESLTAQKAIFDELDYLAKSRRQEYTLEVNNLKQSEIEST